MLPQFMQYSVESALIHNHHLKMCHVVTVYDNLHARLGQGGMRACGEAGEVEFDSVVCG